MKKLYTEYKKMIDEAILVLPGRQNNCIGTTFEDVEKVIRNDVLDWLKRVEVAKMALSYMEQVKAEKFLEYSTDKEFDDQIEEIISDKIKVSNCKNDG